MRKLSFGAFIIGAVLAGGYAFGQIVSGLPFQLQNDTLADATQVMADFNQIVNNVNANAAKNGANNDITSLNALSTPLSPQQGGTTTWLAGTSTGSANAQAITTLFPATFGSLTIGYRFVFKVGIANTGDVGLNINASGSGHIYRQTQLGAVPLVGGELRVGQMAEVVWDGTTYQLVGTPDKVGFLDDYIGASAPLGWGFADGSCVSQTGIGATLFTIAGTGWGSCGAGLFALPDLRARVTIAPDAGANRVTLAGSACDATALATGCGAQNQSFTLVQGNLPAYTLPNTLGINNTMGLTNTLGINNTMGVSDTRTWITSNALLPAGGATAPGAGGITGAATAQQAVVVNTGAINLTGTTTLTGTINLTGGTSLTGGVTSGGSGTAVTMTTLQPTLVMNKIIKY